MAKESSLVGDFTSEWRKRPIDLWQVITSFVSQLSLGQDLTRIALPTEICHPFSILELIAYRELSYFGVLFDINKHPDNPEERFLCVMKWLCSLLHQEQMEKKPFNPVIGEVHTCWVDHGEDDVSEFVAEQVSHHPPLTAFFLRNKKANLTLHSNLEFAVHFGGNHATITTDGGVVLHTGFEDYIMDKMAPNMIIQRVIYGVKYFMWEGDVSVRSDATGYSATFNLHEEDENTNRLKGKIFFQDKQIYEMEGVTGGIYQIWPPADDSNKRTLFDSSYQAPPLKYPPPECRIAMDSLKLWEPVAQAIVDRDMPTADQAKKAIEQAQRVREKKREAAGEDYNAQFFIPTKKDGKIVSWQFNTERSVDKEFLEKMKVQAAAEEEARKEAAEKERAEREAAAANAPPAADEENCTIN